LSGLLKIAVSAHDIITAERRFVFAEIKTVQAGSKFVKYYCNYVKAKIRNRSAISSFVKDKKEN